MSILQDTSSISSVARCTDDVKQVEKKLRRRLLRWRNHERRHSSPIKWKRCTVAFCILFMHIDERERQQEYSTELDYLAVMRLLLPFQQHYTWKTSITHRRSLKFPSMYLGQRCSWSSETILRVSDKGRCVWQSTMRFDLAKGSHKVDITLY
jgi:hypothetical protein